MEIIKKIKEEVKIILIVFFFVYLINIGTFSKNTINKENPEYLNIETIINNYLFEIPEKYKKAREQERMFLTNYLNLKDLPTEPSLVSEIKSQLLKKFSKEYKKRLKKLDTVFLTHRWFFGNTFISLNNLIFYCEIIGCKNILFNSKYRWYIENPVIYQSNNNKTITISKASEDSINCNDPKVICSFLGGFLYYPKVIKPQVKLHYLKNEIIKNVPKVVTNPNDLYIHIRSGDIFTNPDVTWFYAQPPLCFYIKIIKKNKFNNIYIISEDKSNIVIDKLLDLYKNIKYKQNDLDIDISYLLNAYNVVASVSSFFHTIIKLNENVKKMWEYDIYRMSEKFLHLHHDFYKFPIKYKIYTMKPTINYRKIMFQWLKSNEQLDLMINEKCPNGFIIKKPII